MAAFDAFPDRYDFPTEEAQTAKFWKESDIFKKSLELREGKPSFVFYEGPPTANGMPHPGHVLTRVMKDLFPRFKTMKGFRVPRKAGWDTHGLPVEIEVEKALGISGKEAIEEYGVEDFCKRCIESVFVYTKEWEELTERIGFWVDLSDAYVTFHKSYVESVWWSLKTLFERGLLYQDRKIVWWWAQGGTTLSQAEVGQGYRDTIDPSVVVRFKDAEQEDLSYLAWTTTPWTLPSNVGLAVSKTEQYVEVTLNTEDGGTERVVVAADLVDSIFGSKKKKKKKADDALKPVSVSDPFPGADLVGRKYQQLLPWKAPDTGESFRIIEGDFVVVDASQEHGSGTGIVHIAPAFGEDDYRVSREAGLGFLQLVDTKGCMTEECGEDLVGLFCKDADRPIIRKLTAQGSLVKEEQYQHEYPFCWRAKDDPLIQYARPAWFVKTSEFKDELLANNEQIQWVPENIKTGRFGKFLEGNVDWALSRERFWGTPLPVWKCESTGHLEAISSYEELLAKPDVTGTEMWENAKAESPELSDHLKVHKPYIDAVNYASPKDPNSRMRRVTEVIDCWYDSGAMPFAQWGYPHVEDSDQKFADAFPADFICEAIDQTRGWFYSMLAESTLVQQDKKDYPHPYKTCIVLGHVCDDKGIKMSKSLGNYVSPNEAMDAHGADALRWYFLSQGHPWTNARFSLTRVGEAKKDFLIRLQNVLSFFLIYAKIDGFDPAKGNAKASTIDADSLSAGEGYRPVADRGLMDRWILSELNLTVQEVDRALENYEILPSTSALFDFVDRLSNWYVRRSRPRFWGSGLTEDKYDAYWTLYECLVTVSRLCAPFVPFFADSIYRRLVSAPWSAADGEASSQATSVHLTDFPEPVEALLDRDLSKRMKTVLDLVQLGRATRRDAKLRVRQPLSSATVCLADPSEAEGLTDLLDLVAGELNVKNVVFASDADKFVNYMLRPNFKRIGPRIGPKVQLLKKVLADADAAALRSAMDANGYCEVDVDGEALRLDEEDIEIRLEPKEGITARADRGMVLVLDTELNEDLVSEWQAREVIATVNGLRGERGLAYEARIELKFWGSDALEKAIRANEDYVKGETLALGISYEGSASDVSPAEGAKDGAAGEDAFWVDLTVA